MCGVLSDYVYNLSIRSCNPDSHSQNYYSNLALFNRLKFLVGKKESEYSQSVLLTVSYAAVIRTAIKDAICALNKFKELNCDHVANATELKTVILDSAKKTKHYAKLAKKESQVAIQAVRDVIQADRDIKEIQQEKGL